MVNSIVITKSLIIFDLADPGVISHEIKNISWVV